MPLLKGLIRQHLACWLKEGRYESHQTGLALKGLWAASKASLHSLSAKSGVAALLIGSCAEHVLCLTFHHHKGAVA